MRFGHSSSTQFGECRGALALSLAAVSLWIVAVSIVALPLIRSEARPVGLFIAVLNYWSYCCRCRWLLTHTHTQRFGECRAAFTFAIAAVSLLIVAVSIVAV